MNPVESDEAVFAFDAVDANWAGFGAQGSFDSDSHRMLGMHWRNSGARCLDRMRTVRRKPPSTKCQFTTLRSRHEEATHFGIFCRASLKRTGSRLSWRRTGRFPVDVYGEILAAAVEAFLLSATPTNAAESAALSDTFDVDLWPDAAEAEIDQVLAGSGAAHSLVAYDVGQGAAVWTS